MEKTIEQRNKYVIDTLKDIITSEWDEMITWETFHEFSDFPNATSAKDIEKCLKQTPMDERIIIYIDNDLYAIDICQESKCTIKEEIEEFNLIWDELMDEECDLENEYNVLIHVR